MKEVDSQTNKIIVTWGVGEGNTSLAAFDAALFDAGIANYNLITLSSVIPEGFEPKVKKIDFNNQEHGYRLYLVLANAQESEISIDAWAGLGWVMNKDNSQKGLFVEHHGHSEKEVKNLITETLNSMTKYRKDEYGPINFKTVGIKCKDKPVCALVAALYKTEDWK